MYVSIYIKYLSVNIYIYVLYIYMGVSKNNVTPKSSTLMGFSIIFTIHFGVPLFLETPICYINVCSEPLVDNCLSVTFQP